jgi:hypothetical protein
MAKDTKLDELVKTGSVGDIAKALDVDPGNIFVLPLHDGDTPQYEIASHIGRDGAVHKIVRIWRKEK